MELIATIGAPIDKDAPVTPTVKEIIIDKADDSDRDVLIVRASDGRWFAQYDDGPGIVTARSATELSAKLWKDGTCPYWVAEALFRIGWLTLDRATLSRVDNTGWRQRDPVG